MLSAQRVFEVDRPIEDIWVFVKDMNNWAVQMPGYISHQVVDENKSSWTVQVNLGPFKRPVVIDIEVTKWLRPSEVEFNLRGRFEPFHGSGRYRAEARGASTKITLDFEAEPSGSMAKMIEGLGRPVLERVANEFSLNLADALQPDRQIRPPDDLSMLQRIKRWWLLKWG